MVHGHVVSFLTSLFLNLSVQKNASSPAILFWRFWASLRCGSLRSPARPPRPGWRQACGGWRVLSKAKTRHGLSSLGGGGFEATCRHFRFQQVCPPTNRRRQLWSKVFSVTLNLPALSHRITCYFTKPLVEGLAEREDSPSHSCEDIVRS